jgi:hypothetical protein
MSNVRRAAVRNVNRLGRLSAAILMEPSGLTPAYRVGVGGSIPSLAISIFLNVYAGLAQIRNKLQEDLWSKICGQAGLELCGSG